MVGEVLYPRPGFGHPFTIVVHLHLLARS